MSLADVNWIAVLVAAVAAFVLGGLWYGPLFGKTWQGHVGLSDEDLASKGHPAVIMGSAFLLTVVQAAVLGATLPSGAGIAGAVGHALIIAIAFVATAFAVNYLFSRHFAILPGTQAAGSGPRSTLGPEHGLPGQHAAGVDAHGDRGWAGCGVRVDRVPRAGIAPRFPLTARDGVQWR